MNDVDVEEFPRGPQFTIKDFKAYDPSTIEVLFRRGQPLQRPKLIVTDNNWPEGKCRTSFSWEIDIYKEDDRM